MGYCLTLARAIVPSSLGWLVTVTTSTVVFAQSGPSFNCAGNLSAIEMVICRNTELSSLDRQLASAYGTLTRELVGLSLQYGLRNEQKEWLRQRGTCGTDEACIAGKYRSRIEQLQQQSAGPSTAEMGSQPPAQDRGQAGIRSDDSIQTPPGPDSQIGAAAIQMRPRKYECRMEAWADRYKERNIDVYYTEEPSEARKFDDESLVRTFVRSSAQAALRYCSQQPHFGGNHMPPPIPATQVTIHVGELAFGYISSNEQFLAGITLSSGDISVARNTVAEAQHKRDRAAEAQRAQEEQKNLAAQELERKKAAALADCGAKPSIVGGPWFSSTYKVAVMDQARLRSSSDMFAGSFLCIKSIEYIGPAVNPMGGNAARAKFFGYDRSEFNARSEVQDFPY